jgi:hypothetical protein
MDCDRLSRNAAPAGRWHRLRCAACRAARSADAVIAREVLQMRAEPAPGGGLSRTLAAVRAVEPAGGVDRSRRRRIRRGLTLPAVGVGLLGLSAAWWHDMNANPNVVIPTPVLPQPNAYDFYRAAGFAVRERDKIETAIAQNTAAPPKDRPRSAPAERGAPHRYTLAEKEALVRENADALNMLRAGFAYPYQDVYLRSYNTVFPHYPRFRDLARLLALEAQTKAARGDWDGAIQSDLDAMQLGEEAPHGGPLIGKLFGIACQAIGRAEAWDAVDHLNAAQARAAARRLEATLARCVSFADTMREEKWLGQGCLMELFRKPDWRGEMASLGMQNTADYGKTEAESPSRVENFALRTRLLFDSKRKIMDSYARYMDAAIAGTERPYAVRPPAPPLPGDIVNRIVLPSYTQARYADVFYETQNALLAVTLALRAYRLEHGVYPDALSALVPRYLRSVPDDPFALPGPLRYRRDGRNYLLYSVGPDGKDDGGRPVQNRDMAAKALRDARRFGVSAKGEGDIVAGVNRLIRSW